jgi:hypothetical protein
MEFLYHEVSARHGDLIQVTLQGNEANVLVMDYQNFRSYQSGGRYSYVGGHYQRSPAVIAAPGTGTWYVVIDLGGRVGRVQAGVRVISTAMA